MNHRRQYCTLRVGDLYLGIGVERIQEVLRDTSITPVPLAHATINGLINLRGQIVTAIDLRQRMGLGVADLSAGTSTMVLGTNEEPLALVVDSVGDVVDVTEIRKDSSHSMMRLLMVTEIERVSQALQAGADEYIMKPFDRNMLLDKLVILGIPVEAAQD